MSDTMPLFRERPVRSTIAVIGALCVGYYLTAGMSSLRRFTATYKLKQSLKHPQDAFHLTQTSVAILAISSLMFLVTMHHRRDGQLLSRAQEEMVLISGFGLLFVGKRQSIEVSRCQYSYSDKSWILEAVLLAWRARSAVSGPGDLDVAGRQRESRWPYPCSSDDIYCVVEDYTYW
ncbi:hypothetical protein H0H81_008660 [Sphagnurus paluster]|uniref:Uncharacterized protein n=1 Tax=Sphagnurus paluster TaxID=117069 RepID=A0A9P7GQ40_9AGAR|nr:hypothetical protein H0H81_008660 [Sphagnurus paluster]